MKRVYEFREILPRDWSETGEILRQQEIQPDIKIIIISAHGTIDNAVEAMKLGAADFLQKPFTPQELRNVVYSVLQHESLSHNEGSSYHGALKMAQYWASKQQFDRAIAHAKKAIGCDPSQPDAFNLLGELLEIEGDRMEALKHYRVATDLDPTYKPAQNNLERATRSPKTRPNWK